jgi:hypothetical protein
MYHHLFSCIAGRFLVLFFISFSFPRQYPVLGISHLPLHEALLVRSLIIRSCCAVLTFRRIIRLFFRTISFFLSYAELCSVSCFAMLRIALGQPLVPDWVERGGLQAAMGGAN